MVAQVVMSIAVVFVEYGFNLTATRHLAQMLATGANVKYIFDEVNLTKLVLCLVCALIFLGGFYIEAYEDLNLLLLSISSLTVLGAALSPTWAMMGLERFGLLSIAQASSRMICSALIIVLVEKPDDVLIATLLLSLPNLLCALVLIPATHRISGSAMLSLSLASWENILAHLSTGLNIFISQLSTLMFSATNTLIVGYIIGPSAAGQYSLAEKFMRGLAFLVTPVTDAIYPRVAKSILIHEWKTLRFLRGVLLVGVPLLFAGGLALYSTVWAFSSELEARMGVKDLASILLPMIPIPILVLVNNVLGTQILLCLGHYTSFRNIILLAGLSVPCLAIPFTTIGGAVGASSALLCGEALLVVVMGIKVYRLVGAKWLL